MIISYTFLWLSRPVCVFIDWAIYVCRKRYCWCIFL